MLHNDHGGADQRVAAANPLQRWERLRSCRPDLWADARITAFLRRVIHSQEIQDIKRYRLVQPLDETGRVAVKLLLMLKSRLQVDARGVEKTANIRNPRLDRVSAEAALVGDGHITSTHSSAKAAPEPFGRYSLERRQRRVRLQQ